MSTENSPLVIRPSSPDDEEFVVATAERLTAFPLPAWRSASEIVSGEVRTLRAHYRERAPGATLLIAADARGRRHGFVFLEVKTDYFTGAPHGHVGILAVAAASEGTGVGHALLDAAERWARDQGFARLTLNVFDANHRARSVYEHLGYRPETLHYVRTLEPRRRVRANLSAPQVSGADFPGDL